MLRAATGRERLIKLPEDPLAYGTIGVLFIAMLFGGASRANELRLAIVELSAIPLLGLALGRLVHTGRWSEHQLALAIAAAIAAVPLIQLVPLPSDLWSSLPGREDVGLAAAWVGGQDQWRPISVNPDLTWSAALALVPPLAIFAATLAVRSSDHRAIAGAVILTAILNVLVGVGQVSMGEQGVLYPYGEPTFGGVVGLFSNRNHLATLILAAVGLSAVFLSTEGLRRSAWPYAMTGLTILLSIIALGVVRSRAGILLAPVAIMAALATIWAAGRRPQGRGIALGFLGAAAVMGVALVAGFESGPILQRFTQDDTQFRFQMWPQVAVAADSYLPMGSGIGTFDPVFRAVERPQDVNELFLNHAHNDYLEIWLEAGAMGAAVAIFFLAWFGRSAIHLVSASGDNRLALGLGSMSAIGLILVHSLFDYPLRTEIVACVFAACCAMLEKAAQKPRRARSGPSAGSPSPVSHARP